MCKAVTLKMMRRLFQATLVTVLMTVLAGAGPCLAGKIDRFSAEQARIDAAGKTVQAGKLYVMPDRIRMENPAPNQKGEMVMIFRRDKKLSWMINPRAKKYYEAAMDDRELAQAMQNIVKENVVKRLGTEKVSGYKCEKTITKTTVEAMGFKQTVQMTVWKSAKFDFPLRTRGEDGNTTELRKIKKGRQPDELFQLPAGYTRVPNMMVLFMDGFKRPSAGDSDEPEAASAGSSAETEGDTVGGVKLPFKLPKVRLPFGSD